MAWLGGAQLVGSVKSTLFWRSAVQLLTLYNTVIYFSTVGKSSVINIIVASSKNIHGGVRVVVATLPGKTNHFQTLLLPDCDAILLCDCPSLVFPSFVSSSDVPSSPAPTMNHSPARRYDIEWQMFS